MEVLQQRPIDSEMMALRLGGFSTNSGKRNCFREAKSAFCGNQVKEPGEQCDCGYSDEDCQTMKDKCCFPRQSGNGCKLVAGAKCSPSEGPCCNPSNCFVFNYIKSCRAESECLSEQQCDGKSAECPPSIPKKNGIPCQDSTKVCNAGSCNGSICAQVGLKDCFLTTGPPEHLCHLACEDGNGTCRSSLDYLQFSAGTFMQSGRSNKPGLILLPGSPCNNYKGYCDIFRKCRSVDADGPLARLKNVIFNPKTFHEVKYWIQTNWWVVVVGGLFLLVFMATFIKIFAVHTPSTNPNKAPALNIYDTLRRPKNLIQRSKHSQNPPNLESSRRSAGHSDSGERLTNNRHSFHPVASAPPLPPPVPAIPVPVASNSVLVIEPPPPYSSTAGIPKRGHRRNRLKENVELRVKNRRN